MTIRSYFRFVALIAITLAVGCSKPLVLQDAQVNHTQISTKSAESASIQTLLMPYRHKVDSIMKIPVGTAARELSKQSGENLLGNACTELLLSAGIKWAIGAAVQIPTLALLANGGLRVPIAKGPINMGTMFELMPFENEVVVLTLKGSVILQVAEVQAKYRNLNLAGAIMVCAKGKLEAITIGGKPVEPESIYQLVTIDYLADGGDNMACLGKVVKRTNTNLKLRDTFVAEIRALDATGQSLDSKLEGRYQER